eukprot:108338_1
MKQCTPQQNNAFNMSLLILFFFSFGCIFMYTTISHTGNITIQTPLNKQIYSSNVSESVSSNTAHIYGFGHQIRESVSNRNKQWTEQVELLINQTKNIKKLSAVIIILVRHTKIISLIKQLNETLFQSNCMNWISKYPFYIITNDLIDPILIHNINQTIKQSLHANNIKIFDITKYWKLSKHYLLSTDTIPALPGAGESYRIMCSFWSSIIFEIDEISQFDYYMRLDDDSYLNCDCTENNIAYNQCKDFDPFIYMNKNELLYGYWNLIPDIALVSKYFAPFMKSYLERNELSLHIPSLIYKNKRRVDTFYNNWEIGYIPYFKLEPIKHFSNSVMESNGYFLYRWGDAIIRYFQIGLWLDKKYIWCMFNTEMENYFHYKHDAKIFNYCKYHL